METNELLQAIRQIVQEENAPLKTEIGSLRTEIIKTQSAIENDIKPKLQALYEGHLVTQARLERLETQAEEHAAKIDNIQDTVSVLKSIRITK